VTDSLYLGAVFGDSEWAASSARKILLRSKNVETLKELVKLHAEQESDYIRTRSAYLLCLMTGERRFLDELLEMTRARSWKTRWTASNRLAMLGEKELLPEYRAMFSKDECFGTRLAGAAGLLRVEKDDDALSFLLENLDRIHQLAREFTIEAIGRAGDARAIPAIAKHIAEYPENFGGDYQYCASALGDIGHEDGIPVLRKLLVTRWDHVRLAAHEALEKIRKK
jgi:HEAT repeat protein